MDSLLHQSGDTSFEVRDGSAPPGGGGAPSGDVVCPCGRANPGNRNFCAACGKKLWLPCVACQGRNAASAEFCGTCGVRLADARQERLRGMQRTLVEAGRLRGESRYQEAVELLEGLQHSEDPELDQFAADAAHLQKELVAEHERRQAEMQIHLQQAELCLLTQDYAGAVDALQAVPPPLRTPNFSQLLIEATARRDEVQRLKQEIREAVAARRLDGLLPKVERLRDLKSDDPAVHKLHEQIGQAIEKDDLRRREQLCREARQLLAEHHYRRAYDVLERIPAEVWDETARKLHDFAQETAWLSAQLQEAPYADATLRAIAARLLKLAPKDERAARRLEEIDRRIRAAIERGPPGLAPWAKPPEQCRVGYAVDWGVGFQRLIVADAAAEALRARPGCFAVAAGLALQGLGQAPVFVNLLRGGKPGATTRPPRGARRAWGLDLSNSGVKAVLLEFDSTGQNVLLQAAEYCEHELPLNAPAGEASRQAIISETLDRLRERRAFKGCALCVGLCGSKVLSRFFKLPPMPAKKLPAAMKYEARQQVPFPEKETVWDGQMAELEQDDSRPNQVQGRAVLIAAKRFHVDQTVDALKACRLRADVLQSDALALHNLIAWDRFGVQAAAADDPHVDALAVVDIGADVTNVVVSGPAQVWCRTVRLGSDNLTAALSREFKLTREAAEKLKRNPAGAARFSRFDEAVRPVFAEMHREIELSLNAYCNAKGLPVGRLLVLGGGLLTYGLLGYLRGAK